MKQQNHLQKAAAKHKCLLLISQIWKQAGNRVVKVFFSDVDFQREHVKITRALTKSSYIKEDFVLLEPNFMKKLDTMERKIVIDIMSELKQYNPLWYCDYRKIGGKFERAILSLRKKKILFETGNNEMHIVNPWFIKRGDIKKLIPSIFQLINDSPEINRKMIKHLSPPDETSMGIYYGMITSMYNQTNFDNN